VTANQNAPGQRNFNLRENYTPAAGFSTEKNSRKQRVSLEWQGGQSPARRATAGHR